MRVRDEFEGRAAADREAHVARLPLDLKTDPTSTRIGILRRLAGSRTYAPGTRPGALRAAWARSGRGFGLDVRQRVVVKALVSRHVGGARGVRAGALAKHVQYLARSGAGEDGARPAFFDRHTDAAEARRLTLAWREDRHHFRFIISPEHGDRITDLRGYVRDTMARVAADLGEPRLSWMAVCHFDTDQPHAHVLVRGRREDGRDLVIPRAYIAYGVRARAQEVAQERLGDLSRLDAERRVWRETQADRFTGLDRRLLAAADADRMVDDGVGASAAWAALTRGRLRRLEQLGLAARDGRRYRLDADLERRLRGLQIRQDVIRTLNERRLAGVLSVRELGRERVSGRVTRSGTHDELGAAGFVVIRDAAGVEHYARLGLGAPPPAPGAAGVLIPTEHGARFVSQIRSAELGR